jgi:hypothetical protein
MMRQSEQGRSYGRGEADSWTGRQAKMVCREKLSSHTFSF